MNSILRKLLFAICALALAGKPSTDARATGGPPPTVELWEGRAPGASGDSDEDKPAIYPYLPSPDKNTGAGILICPGGGFMTRCADYEGVLVAQWLKSRGVAGFILRYRIRPVYSMKETLLDAQRGLQYLRSHAREFRLAPDRLGLIGFSAGATLAATAASQHLPAKPDSKDAVERVSSRPDFVILAYGSANLRESRPTNAPEGAFPPAFLFGTGDDPSVNGMTSLFTTLRRRGVRVEAHFFAFGEHGVGFAEGDPTLGEWPGLALNWMRVSGFLSGGERVAIRGVVLLDGEPLARGCVLFTPLDAAGAPTVAAYVMNTGPVRGEFAARPEQGPVPGRYRIEVRQDALHWLSNSRNPIMVKMNQKQRDGVLTDEDRREWFDYARKRDLAPAIDDQRVFRRKHPSDPEDLIVEIKPGLENRINLEVFSR